MGREPGAGVMREPEGRAEAVAGTFNAQEVTNTLSVYFSCFSALGQGCRWVHTLVVQRLPKTGGMG